ncbi:MAG: PrsW family intramembrane metalloprotease [Chloroflexi bacterium]|nr:PrsW family intramembrane metalloprotease [Chloroflexota bacterium]
MGWEALVLATLAAGLPTAMFLALVWWLDRYETEPTHLLVVTFMWGVLPAAVLAVVLDVALSTPLAALGDPAAEWQRARLLAPLVEETVKGAALVSLIAWRRSEFNGVLDGIVYGAVVGLGFAFTENWLTYLALFGSAEAGPGLLLVPLRAVVFGLNHPVFSGLFGASLGWAFYHGGRWSRRGVPLLGLAAAVGLHYLHNALAAGQWGAWWALPLAIVADWSGVALLVALVALAWVSERRWLRDGLRDEVSLGTLTTGEFRRVVSHRRRAAAELRAFQRLGWRGYRQVARHHQALTELAFARMHPRCVADDRHAPADLDRLRALVRRRRPALAEAGAPVK